MKHLGAEDFGLLGNLCHGVYLEMVDRGTLCGAAPTSYRESTFGGQIRFTQLFKLGLWA
ncbi:hypothetical protein D3C78_1967040 [compost metagenome]